MTITAARRRRIGWPIMTFLAFGIVGYASRYFGLDPDVFFEQQRDTYVANQLGILTHIAGGSVALAVGPFQFLGTLRAHRPALHRWLGRVYLAGVLFGSAAGLFMAFIAHGGMVTTAGFGTLAVLWFGTGLAALRAILGGDIDSHRRWMVRNFALTFAAVTLRLWLLPLAATFGFDDGYRIVSWLCWVPNLAAAEVLLRRSLGRAPELVPA